jgi:hypothetical protein
VTESTWQIRPKPGMPSLHAVINDQIYDLSENAWPTDPMERALVRAMVMEVASRASTIHVTRTA